MRIRVLAAGTRMPDWVDEGVQDYLRRLRGELRVEFEEIPLARRSGTGEGARARAEEGRRMMSRLREGEFVVALEVTGRGFSTEEVAGWLRERMRTGSDIVMLIGGPDGLSPECRLRADLQWSLSPLTMPHALVRVVLAEQLYRALTLVKGHPYHRG